MKVIWTWMGDARKGGMEGPKGLPSDGWVGRPEWGTDVGRTRDTLRVQTIPSWGVVPLGSMAKGCREMWTPPTAFLV